MIVSIDIAISFLIAIIWGAFPFAISYIVKDLPVHLALLCLSFIAFVYSFVYSFTKYGTTSIFHDLHKAKYTTLVLIAVAAFLGVFLKNILYFYVLDITSRLNVVVSIMSLSSVVSLLIGLSIFRVHLNIGIAIGIILTSIGVFVMLTSGRQHISSTVL
jgi:drug/metabolite transporter (DMT)-like permease